MLRNRRLTELVRDVPLPVAPDALVRRPFERERVHEVFDALQFRVLRERLFAEHSEDAATAAGAEIVVDTEVLTAGVTDWLATHTSDGSRSGVAFVGEWGRGSGDVVAVTIAAADGAVAHVPVRELSPADDTALATWLADAARPKAIHDAKGPELAIRSRGWALAGLTCDTALAAYLVLPGQRTFELDDLVARFLRRELGGGAASAADQLSFDTDADAEAAAASGARARAVRDLADALETELEARGGTTLMREVELPLLHVLADLEQAGIAVDLAHLEGLESEFGEHMRGAEIAAHELAGRPFNLGSPKQLQEILFGERGLPTTKKIKTGYTTDAEALQDLYVRTGDPLLEQLLRWRDVSKLRQTVDGPAGVGVRRRSDPHDVQPDRRRHRSPVVAGPQPAEHPDPHRRGPPHPQRLRRRPRVRDAAHRRLQPDRDAAHGAPVRGRRADRGVPLRRGPAQLRRARACSAWSPPRSTPTCGARSRRCRTAWPTASRRTACRSSWPSRRPRRAG